MQFYDFFKDLINYIPQSFHTARSLFELVLPFVLMACALFTAFFGLKCASVWCALTFFFTGCVVSANLLLDRINVFDYWFWIIFAICLTVGVLCGVFSKYLFRLELVVSEFGLVFASMPSVLLFLGGVPAKVLSFIIALAIAFLTVKYKYIIVIVTTSFSGSFIFWDFIEKQFAFRFGTLCAVATGLLALAFQVWMNWDALKKTYKDVRMKAKKTKRGGEKLLAHIKDHPQEPVAVGAADAEPAQEKE